MNDFLKNAGIPFSIYDNMLTFRDCKRSFRLDLLETITNFDFKSPANMASRISTILLSPDPDELCNRIKYILREKQVGNNSDMINEKIVAIVDKINRTQMLI